MIRINLLPKKRKAGKTPAGPRGAKQAATGGGPGQWWILAMVVLWISVAAVGYWLLSLEDEQIQSLRQQAAAQTKQAEVISKEIDETGLEARKAELDQVEAAIEKLEDKRRTPVFVMYELSMLLTDAKEGGGPDIDKERYRQILKQDPNNKLNERWDPTGLWLKSVVEKQGTLVIEGAARDATDLSEFTRRLRASARFGNIKHPDFTRVSDKSDKQASLEWTLDVAVRRWD
jgi:Tfp pilus assembly protein PilN